MIDLHVHSVYSDGFLTVEELIDNARINKVNIMSITDHDTILGIKEYAKNINDKIIIIPGVEISTETYYLGKKTKIHLLGYGYDLYDESFNKMLTDLYKRHYNDNKEYIEKLIIKFKFLSSAFFDNFNYGRSGWLYKNILNYIYKYLTKEQFEELKEYLINNKPNYNKYNESVEDSIKLINECGGYSVLAHPQKCNLSEKELNILVKYLKENGLDGLETYHIESNDIDRKIIHDLAVKYGLYETGGSDFHSFIYGNGVGDTNIRFPENYDPKLVKRLIKENKVFGGKNE